MAVAAKVKDGTITSSPGPSPRASSERCSADVPELTATQYAAPVTGANSSSNAFTSGPCTTMPLRSTRTAASMSASEISGLAAGIRPRS